ncbi:MT-A70 family methyltransferase (plasmid) [Salipiger sp. H15]|uniref:MT-A70 family methyltransferase n=1 Tax=Alloyangia sp. H15 TaxID=3029062 RepID=A0AAU8AQI1_9RHOB
MHSSTTVADDLRSSLEGQKFGCVLADLPWRLREGAEASHRPALGLDEICALPVAELMEDRAHCYLWVPNALLPEGMQVLDAWGFKYTSNIVWQKAAPDGGLGAPGEGDVFGDVTALLLFGTRGKNVRTLAPARSQVNFIPPGNASVQGGLAQMPKPDEQYGIIERCSWGPFLELFGHGAREGWTVWDGRA